MTLWIYFCCIYFVTTNPTVDQMYVIMLLLMSDHVQQCTCAYILTMFLINLSQRCQDSWCWVHLACDNARVIEMLHLHENLISEVSVVEDISQLSIHIPPLN